MKEIKKTKLDDLGNELIKLIKERKNIFQTIQIVVPNSRTEQWFKTMWLKTQNNILMNVKFINVNEALVNFIKTDRKYILLNKENLKSLIIKNLSLNNINIPDSIMNYYYNDKILNSIKLYDLANQLSKLFIEYENDQFEIFDWQKELYNLVLNEASIYNLSTPSYLYNTISNKQLMPLESEIYFFGFHQFTNLQKTILNHYNSEKIVMFLLEKEEVYTKEFTLTGAPSKLREIELLHSNICSLIYEKNVEYSDILVLAPDVSAYENIISRVFKQDNVKYPNIPFSINDKKKIETNVSLGLKKLFEIINKKYYTRLDFYSLINNKDIQQSRNITNEDVINWSRSIVSMNAYRNSKNRTDWEYVKKRVLLSKVSNVNDIDNNIIQLKDDSYIPFDNIEFTDESIIKFVSIIDNLNSWLECISSIKTINNDNLGIIINELNKWFSIKDSNGFEINGYFKNIISLINNWSKMEISDDLIPLDTLVYQIYDVSKVYKVKASDYFMKGITFADFNDEAILSTNYIFFLNAGSKELPKQVFKSELDLRDYDISKTEKVEKAFNLQYQNANEHFYISYINKDLKTDEDLYLSSLVSKLYFNINNSHKSKDEIKYNILSIDETRQWSELFTKKSHKNKAYFEGLVDENELVSGSKFDINNEINIKSERRKKIRVREMADFLEEPLKYKINYLFAREDSLSEDIKEEYEPFDLSALLHSGLIKSICLDALINRKYEFDDEIIKNLIDRFNLNHQLPDISEKINYTSFLKVIKECEDLINCVVNKTNYNYEIKSLDDLTFIDSYNNGAEVLTTEWRLTCKEKVCISKNGLNRTYIQIKKMVNNKKAYEYLFLYIFSLMDIASEIQYNSKEELGNTVYSVELCRGESKKFNVTPNEARDILITIYNMMNNFEDNVCLPFEFFNNEKIVSLNKFISEVTTNCKAWSFFDSKNILDYDSQLGYTEHNFLEKFKSKKEECIKLIKFYETDQAESDGELDE